jgi:hypothetical protein
VVGAAAEHGREVALHDPQHQPAPDLLDRELAGLEELVHERLVAGGRLLEQLVAGLGDRVLQVVGDRDALALLLHVLAGELPGPVVDEVHDAREGLGLADGELDRHGVDAQALAQRAHRRAEVGVLLVHHVDRDQDRRLLLAHDLPDHLGPDLDAAGSAHQQQGGIGDAQRAVDVPDEVRVAGRVEQVDLVSLPLELRQRQVDRDLARDLVGRVVEQRGPVRDAAEAVRRLGVEQHGFGERGLADTVLGDESDIADLSGGELLQKTPPRQGGSCGCRGNLLGGKCEPGRA